MRSDNSPQRLACPRCRANNFVGQAQCWQCKASLPPPEAVNTPTVMGWAQQAGASPVSPILPPQAAKAQPTNPQGNRQTAPAVPLVQEAPVLPRRGRKTPLVMAGALITASVVVWFVFHRAAPPANTSGLSLPPGVSVPPGVLPDGILPGSHDIRFAQPDRDPVPFSADPTEAAARRAVQRAIPRLGLPPGTGSDGTVHLRNGDTISREQYEATQEKLKNNPLLGGPPTVPRL